MHRIVRHARVLFIFALFIVCAGCDGEANEAREPLEKLRVTVLPDQDAERLRRQYAGLIEYLASELGLETELIPASSYTEVIDLFHRDATDLVFFGGVTFVMANRQDGAIPLIAREEDQFFTSYLLVAANSKAGRPEDLKGARFAFGSELSTSGHYMPRLYLEDRGLVPETFFSEVKYSGQHDRTAHWVRDGEVDAGVVNARVIDSMFADGLLGADEVRVIWETPPYADYVWAVSPRVNETGRIAIQDAFLGLDPANPEQKIILDSFSASHFVPAVPENYEELTRVIEKYESLGEKAE